MMIVFRVDASLQIGSGHVMRCLTLAGELHRQGAEVVFIARHLEGHLCDYIDRAGFKVRVLPAPSAEYLPEQKLLAHASWLGVPWATDAEETGAVVSGMADSPDWLIVDNYALDARWESLMHQFVGKLMVIDDIADRPHDCDLLLDQNLYENMENRYDGLVPVHCRKLLGPRYALLRSEFSEARKNLRKRDGRVRRILIFFGGSDPSDETAKALEAIRLLNRPDIVVDVIVGEANPHREEIRTLCASMPNTTYYCQIANMAELMAVADLAIGAGGSTTWERCFVGLPSITLTIAKNQAETLEVMAKTRAVWHLGNSTNVNIKLLANTIRRALENPLELKEMGEMAAQIMGGKMFTGDSPLLSAILEKDNAQA